MISRNSRPAFRAWGLLALLLVAAPVLAASLTVTQANQQLYADPAFTSPAVGPVPQGARVNVIREQGDWIKVDYQGKNGWLHRGAASQAAAPAAGLPSLLTGGPVRETKSDEVALAGKGFTPEVEAGYRQKNPSLNYAQVDQVERFQVDQGRFQAFLREGGLNPCECGAQIVTSASCSDRRALKNIESTIKQTLLKHNANHTNKTD